MRMSCVYWAAAILAAAPLVASIPKPADWVPARWNSTDPKTLDLVAGTPINCLLLKAVDPAFAAQSRARGIIALAVISPGGDPAGAARQAMHAGYAGIVLEGDFPQGTVARVKDVIADTSAIIIQLTTRSRMDLAGPDPVIGTVQGVWPGVQVLENGAAKAGPTGSAWIDTNTGFIRSVRAWGHAAVWLGNLPPAHTVITADRYLQALADAALAGGRWVLALDDDFSSRLQKGEAAAVRDWKRILAQLQYSESHPEWRSFQPYAKLAIVQDPSDGALLSGGILDMVGARHTPVRAIPRQKLAPAALKNTEMAVDVDPQALTPEQKAVLTAFTRSGGTLLNAPTGWKAPLNGDAITLEEAETKRLDDIWHDVQSMIGRRNLGARLFNVSSMLSNLSASADGKQVVVQLVNYSSYPADSITVHLLGEFHHATLYTPEGGERAVEVYKTEEGSGVDIDKVTICATLRLE
jgi:hypothetical protein